MKLFCLFCWYDLFYIVRPHLVENGINLLEDLEFFIK